ncbi:unannotated protein [freshwater metagenome]|uniref:Unannotated protein n=1 Tax=freshwater metagenome TaxID=449393 RepID=A0A6J6KMQ9_9ZZZZ
MDNSGGVCGVQSIQNSLHNVEGLSRGESAKIVKQFAKCYPGQVLHHNECDGAVLPLVENINDVGVGKPGCLPRLLDEATREILILR